MKRKRKQIKRAMRRRRSEASKPAQLVGPRDARAEQLDPEGTPERALEEENDLAKSESGRDPKPVEATPGADAVGAPGAPTGVSREAFQQVGKELLNSDLDPATWAQALAGCRGTHDDALALYARIRSQNITELNRCKRERLHELEGRRRGSFRDFKTVPVLTRSPAEERGLPGFFDSIFWHLLAVLGMAGCLLAARLIWPPLFGGVSNSVLALVVVAMQLTPLLAWWMGSGRRGAVTYSGVAQLSACIALLGSVILSVKLLANESRAFAQESGPAERHAPHLHPDPLIEEEDAEGVVVRR